jgi:ribonuclease VapC
MIVDTSAVMTILLSEPDAEQYAKAIDEAEVTRISAATFVEAAIVAGAYAGEAGGRDLDSFMRRTQIVMESVTEEQAHIARQAYADFGKGKHKAGLNFGDCFAYALARVTGEPLLFKGNDFRRTDIIAAL